MTLRRLVALLLVVLLAAPVAAETRRPLLVEGTETIHQRVLTRPGAALHTLPDGPIARRFPAFQPLYVFARRGDWVEVGPSVSAAPAGWVGADRVVDWKQNIVAAFTNPANRSRQLLFESQERLRWLLEHEALRDVQARLVAAAEAGEVADEGVVALEPADYVNIRDELYLMPILDFTVELHPVNYEDILLMEVASIPKTPPAPPAEPDLSDFDVGVVFVFDTTQSMDPYIALTRDVLQDSVRRLADTETGKKISFGVVGFRDNVEAVPEIEYRTRILAPLARREDQAPVIDAIAAATEVARASTPGFNEDSLAGVEDAIDSIDWTQGGENPVDARYVILVTDAGPKDPRDPNARSEIGPAELQADAEDRNIVVMTLHLKTDLGGEANHAYAAGKYRQLSRFAGQEYYYGIEQGSEAAFRAEADRLVQAITDHVRVARGEAAALAPEEAGAEMVALGRAMRLAYLGAQRGTQPPELLRGWLSDKAVEAPQTLAVEPRLLLTKNEMATMAELLDNLVRLGEQAQDTQDASSFFAQVRGVIADMAQNPDRVVNTQAETLGGALEYLERLPYRSQLLQMTEDRWSQSAMLRRSILDGMRQKLAQYRKWLYDDSVWTALDADAPDGEYVFAMPFDVLP